MQPQLAPTTCLVTGGAGFIGSHLTEYLLARGHRVLVIDDLSTGRWENIAHLEGHERFHFARASIEDTTVLDRLTSESRVVFHLAAAVGVRLIVEQPVRTIETNINGTELVLRAALRYRCRTLIASTSEVYGKGAHVPFGEEDDLLLGPTSKSRWAYAASKIVDEFLSLAYHAQYGAPNVCVRLFNTVGPRQTGRYGMVIPALVGQALRGQPLTVYGDGQQSRCFCDVRDVVEGLVGLVAHPAAAGRVFNLGSTEEITILELARRIVQRTGSRSEIVFVPYDQAYAPGFEDMRRRVPDITRIRELIGWQPRRTLDEILDAVIEDQRRQVEARAG